MSMNKIIDANIKNLLGPYYEWDDELYYHGHPLSFGSQTKTEYEAVAKALKMVGK